MVDERHTAWEKEKGENRTDRYIYPGRKRLGEQNNKPTLTDSAIDHTANVHTV